MSKKNKIPTIMLLMAVFCFLMFACYGMFSNVFGVNSANTMKYFAISESKQGMIITVQAIGCFIVSVCLGLYGEKINKLTGLTIGSVLLAFASLLIGLIPKFITQGNGYLMILIFSFIGAVGYSFLDLLMNGVIAEVFPDNKETLLPFVHAFFGTGSMLVPIIVSKVSTPDRPETFAIPFLIIGVLELIFGIIYTCISIKITPQTPYADMTEIRKRVSENPAEIFKEKLAWRYLLICFFHVGFQNGLSNWLSAFSQNVFEMPYYNATMMVTLFFVGNLIARFMCPIIYRFVSGKKYFTIFLMTSTVLFLIFIFADIPMTLRYILIVLVGFTEGGGVPTLILLCCEAFPTRTASASSLFMTGCCLCNFFVPTIMGKMIETIGYYPPMVFIAVLSFLSVLLLNKKEKTIA